MKGVVMILGCVVVVLVVPLVAEMIPEVQIPNSVMRQRYKVWAEWKKTFGKVYTPWEEKYRRAIFQYNLRNIMLHNAQYPEAVSYTQGLNKFSDMTVEEYRSYNRLLTPASRANHPCNPMKEYTGSESLPDTVDWRTKGYVTAVKNQGQCASGWAFSTTGAVEGQHFNKTGHLLPLSEQQLIDCSGAEGNYGCNGGNMDQGFAYVLSQPGGLETGAEYRYVEQTGNCTAKVSKEKAKISGCVDVLKGDELALKRAVALVGPVSVGVNALLASFMHYKGGVYYDFWCISTFPNHGMLVVGYGTYQGQDYWLVKNSWGSDWGLNGYIMMARNRHNNCGIATLASYPLA